MINIKRKNCIFKEEIWTKCNFKSNEDNIERINKEMVFESIWYRKAIFEFILITNIVKILHSLSVSLLYYFCFKLGTDLNSTVVHNYKVQPNSLLFDLYYLIQKTLLACLLFNLFWNTISKDNLIKLFIRKLNSRTLTLIHILLAMLFTIKVI